MAIAPQAGANEEDAKTFFAEGRKLRLDGKCEQAIPSFKRALELYPEGIGALRNIAECEEQLGLFASARNDYWSLRRAAMQSNEPKYQGWDRESETAYNRLATRVAKVIVKLDGEALDRVKVQIDGKPLDPRLIGVEIERDNGTHVFQAAFGGVTPLIEKRNLAEGQHLVVTFTIPSQKEVAAQLAAATPPPPTASAAPTTAPTGPVINPDDEKGRRTARTIGAIALGVGGLAGVATVVSVVVRGSALSTISDSCNYTVTKCPSTLQGNANTGKTASLLANVFGAVTILGIGGGAGLMIYGVTGSSPPKSASASPRASFSVVPLAGGAWAGGEMRF